MMDPERELRALARRYQARKAAFEEAERARDEGIRAVGKRVTAARLAEIFEISMQRVKQIRRGVRV